ncbi:M23 family metallopeptidase [Patescibacteria group bacterium]|nr:M23 family metallopeptidase [Patescibacteria group bacterium]
MVVAFFITFLPKQANAFWPFSTNANAAANTLVPSSSTPVLAATINSNPNAGAPLALATSNDSALISYAGPGGTIADVSNTAPPDRISVYVVRPGDTLSEIAGMFGVSVNTIIWANNLGSAHNVHPGDTLVILPVSGVERTVVKGDTLKSVAKKYGADATEIAEFNGLDPEAALAVGTTIIIPGGEVIAPTSVPATKESRRGVIREPYLGGSGPAQPGYYENPLPGGIITQSIHGWNAVDIGAARGTPIHAAAEGIVIVARNGGWNGGYGIYVVITHGNGTETLYSHMTHAIVSPGERVSGGEIIGYVGATGLATGPHLHFEVRGAANPFRNCDVGSICSPQ